MKEDLVINFHQYFSILADTLPILINASFLISLLIKFLSAGKLVSVHSVVLHGVSTSRRVLQRSV